MYRDPIKWVEDCKSRRVHVGYLYCWQSRIHQILEYKTVLYDLMITSFKINFYRRNFLHCKIVFLSSWLNYLIHCMQNEVKRCSVWKLRRKYQWNINSNRKHTLTIINLLDVVQIQFLIFWKERTQKKYISLDYIFTARSLGS